MISYDQVILKKFVFSKIDLDDEFMDLIWESKFQDFGRRDGEVRYRIRDIASGAREIIARQFLKATQDEYLRECIQEFHFDVNKMTRGEWVPMHNENGQLSPFEVILWLTKNDNFQGRDFLMRDEFGVESKVKPENGMVCFLDTTQESVFHGVSKLLSDTEIISITGGLGRKADIEC